MGPVRAPRLLMMTPLPPPAGGMATWTVRVLRSSVPWRYQTRIVDTRAPNASTSEAGLNLGKLALAGTCYAELIRTLATWRPDVVHVNAAALLPGLYKDLLFVLTARATGAKTVVKLHGSRLERLGRPAYALARRWLRRVDQVYVLSDAQAGRLRDLGIPAERIGNPVDLRPEVARRPHDGPVRLLFVGWVMAAKGIDELLEAVARVPEATLTVVGRFVDDDEGSSEARVRARIDRLGLSGRVRLVGEVPLEEVWGFYEQADVFVLPSWTEGLPNVLLEARMAGLPAVVTPVGAMAEVVRDGVCGRVVPVGDIDALAAALSGLVSDPDARIAMGAAARSSTLVEFETEAVASRLADCYDALLAIDTRSSSSMRRDQSSRESIA